MPFYSTLKLVCWETLSDWDTSWCMVNPELSTHFRLLIPSPSVRHLRDAQEMWRAMEKFSAQMKSFPSSLSQSFKIDREKLDFDVFMSHIFQQYQHSVTVFYDLPKPTKNNILNFLIVLFYITMHTLTSQFLFVFLTQFMRLAKTYNSLHIWTEWHLLLEVMD